MGRTVATFTRLLQRAVEEWSPFRRALRKEDQAVLDALFAKAKRYTGEAAYASPEEPFQAIALAILLEQEKELQTLRRRLEALEEPRPGRGRRFSPDEPLFSLGP